MVALERPKTPANLGNALRAAHAYGVSMVMYSGDRGWHRKIPTDVSRAWRRLPVLQVTDIAAHRPKETRLVAVEIHPSARPLPGYRHPERAVYVFGPEDGSVSDDLLSACDDVVVIPTQISLNLAAAVNVTLYDRTAKSPLNTGATA